MAREYGILCRQDPVPDITWRVATLIDLQQQRDRWLTAAAGRASALCSDKRDVGLCLCGSQLLLMFVDTRRQATLPGASRPSAVLARRACLCYIDICLTMPPQINYCYWQRYTLGLFTQRHTFNTSVVL